jgi:hypothetical protein
MARGEVYGTEYDKWPDPRYQGRRLTMGRQMAMKA